MAGGVRRWGEHDCSHLNENTGWMELLIPPKCFKMLRKLWKLDWRTRWENGHGRVLALNIIAAFENGERERTWASTWLGAAGRPRTLPLKLRFTSILAQSINDPVWREAVWSMVKRTFSSTRIKRWQFLKAAFTPTGFILCLNLEQWSSSKKMKILTA